VQLKITDHAAHTEKLYGLRAEDLHKWIDGYFDREGFDDFLRSGNRDGYNPYEHRQFRHCREALPELVREFSHLYTENQITKVFERHIKDDYDDYIPSREDFTNGTFSEKYHESEASEPILTTSELSRYFKGLYYGRNRKEKSVLGFRFRIVLPAVISLLLFISTVYLLILPLFHDSLMKEKKLMIREISSVAVSVLDYYISLESSGEMSREDAQLAARDEIRKLRYGADHDNYFWITDETPVMIVHPWRSDLEGQDLSDYRDTMNKSGKKLFVRSVGLVKEEGGGFLEYLWQLEEGSQQVVSKLSFVQGVPRWNWIIGTGIYIHDVELEIARLSRRLILVIAVITALMVLIVLYMLMQSRAIEQNRKEAESGLVEAKERYRALVEASNEGYILMVHGQKVFTNPTFQRMTGYGDKELSEDDFFTKLFPRSSENEKLLKHLENISFENPENDEFEASLRCRSGSVLDAVIRISRIFLSEENGHIISFSPVSRDPFSLPLFLDPKPLGDPVLFLEEIRKSEQPTGVIRVLNQMPQIVRSLLSSQTASSEIRHFVSELYDSSVSRIIELSMEDAPPVPFSFLSLGSSGRQEMTLFSDQDNALVFNSVSTGEQLEKERLYFLKLADRICSRLNQAGFPFCPGGIMAVNPAHCLSLNEWKERYKIWFSQADSISLLDLHVFFDMSCAWGEESLVNELKDSIEALAEGKDEFFSHFAHNCLQYKSPINSLGQLRSSERDGRSVLNIKDCLIPLVNFARLYSLKHNIREVSTIKRLAILKEKGILNAKSHQEMDSAFELLWQFRFSNQILSHGELRKVNDDMALKSVSSDNRKALHKALSVINAAQSRLSYDFLGMDIR
jgi:CBS domain-containing protein